MKPISENYKNGDQLEEDAGEAAPSAGPPGPEAAGEEPAHQRGPLDQLWTGQELATLQGGATSVP